jgi:hypothetical protein
LRLPFSVNALLGRNPDAYASTDDAPVGFADRNADRAEGLAIDAGQTTLQRSVTLQWNQTFSPRLVDRP